MRDMVIALAITLAIGSAVAVGFLIGAQVGESRAGYVREVSGPIPRWFVDAVALTVVREIGREHEAAIRGARVETRQDPFYCLARAPRPAVESERGMALGVYGDGRVYVLAAEGWEGQLARGLATVAGRVNPVPAATVQAAVRAALGAPQASQVESHGTR